VAMPMTRWEFRIVPCLARVNASATCLMSQDAGHEFCRCAMTAPMSLFYNFGRNINDSHYYKIFLNKKVQTKNN